MSIRDIGEFLSAQEEGEAVSIDAIARDFVHEIVRRANEIGIFTPIETLNIAREAFESEYRREALESMARWSSNEARGKP